MHHVESPPDHAESRSRLSLLAVARSARSPPRAERKRKINNYTTTRKTVEKTNRNRDREPDQILKREEQYPSAFPVPQAPLPSTPLGSPSKRLDFSPTFKSSPFSGQFFLLFFSPLFFKQRPEDLFNTGQQPFCDRFRQHPGLLPTFQGVPRRQARCCLHKRSDLNPRLACLASPALHGSTAVTQPLHHRHSPNPSTFCTTARAAPRFRICQTHLFARPSL